MGHLQTAIIQLITWAHKYTTRHCPLPQSAPNKPEWNVLLTLLKLLYSQSVYSNIRHPYEGQLTAVNLKHPLTIIAWLYRGLIFLSSSILLKFSADIWFDFGLNYVFLDRETHIRRHMYGAFFSSKFNLSFVFFNFNIRFIELDIRFQPHYITMYQLGINKIKLQRSLHSTDIRFSTWY